MTTYAIRRIEGQRTPLWEVMQDIPPMPLLALEPVPFVRKPKSMPSSIKKLDVRLRLEAMAVGETIDLVVKNWLSVSATAHHVRKTMPEARYSTERMDGFTRVRRWA